MRFELAALLSSTESTVSSDTLHRGYMGSRHFSPPTGATRDVAGEYVECVSNTELGRN